MDPIAALAVPTRRKIVELLARKGMLSAGDIGRGFDVSGPAISQHLKVLEQAKLVSARRVSRQRIYALNPEGLEALEEWTAKTRQLWEGRLDRLDAVIKEQLSKK